MTLKKTLTLTSLLGLTALSALSITNSFGYLDASERLLRYKSAEKAVQSFREECIVTGIPWDQIHDVCFGIGEEVAYRQFYDSRN